MMVGNVSTLLFKYVLGDLSGTVSRNRNNQINRPVIIYVSVETDFG